MTSRRSFLKLSIASGLGYMASNLSSCTSFDQFFLGDKRILEDETVIIGGGVAGLAAALNFKKKRLPYRLYEASGQLGGRVRFYNGFELGADTFDLEDTSLLELLKELKVDYIKEDYLDVGKTFLYKNQFFSKAQLVRPMKTLVAQMDSRYAKLKKQIANQPLESINEVVPQFVEKSSSLLDLIPVKENHSREYLKIAIEHEFGIQFQWMPFFHILCSWPHLKKKYFLSQAQVARFKKGSSDFIKTLVERTQGVVPDHLTRLNEKLIEIKDRGVKKELIFQTPRGLESVFVDRIVFAIPIQQLMQIKGIEKFIDIKDLERQFLFGSYRNYFADIEPMNTKKVIRPETRFFVQNDKKEYWRIALELNKVQMRSIVHTTPLTSEDWGRRAKEILHQNNFLLSPDLGAGVAFSHSFLDVKTISIYRSIFGENPHFVDMKKNPLIHFIGDWTEILQMGSLEAAIRSAKLLWERN